MTAPQGTGVYQSFLTYGRLKNPSTGLPIRPRNFSEKSRGQTVAVLMEFPNHSYGLAGDLHPTSFEIYVYSVDELGESVKSVGALPH